MRLDKQQCLEWGFGNLLENSVRGIVAEFIVATALGDRSDHRKEWNSFDLSFGNSRIEVKSAAFRQSWPQEKPSRIVFDIKERKKFWNATTNEWITSGVRRRIADLYVFCVFKPLESDTSGPLETENWEFFVVPTTELDRRFPKQRSLALSVLRKTAVPVTFDDLRKAVRKACAETVCPPLI